MTQSRSKQTRTFAMLIVTAAMITTTSGCSMFKKETAPQATTKNIPVRAIWVTRYDYKTADDVRRIIDNCARGGFNTVLFQVRGNGTVSYPSKLEPWAEQFDYESPGYDPLALAIEEAHKRGMMLQAWVNVMPAWKGPNEPGIRNQLYFKHPEWFWYDRNGVRQPLNHSVGGKSRGWYVSLNPCLPEVREYIVAVFHDLVARYNVDGLHMDYIRFPNEPVVAGEKIPDYPRDPRTVELFRRATKQDPDQNPAAWKNWRTNQVNQLVADVHKMLKDTRPNALLTAAVGSVPTRGLTHFQDGLRWMDDGIIDHVYLMNYTDSVPKFAQRFSPWIMSKSDAKVVPGLGIREQLETKHGAEIAVAQIDVAYNSVQNFAVFAYASLFDSSNEKFTRQTNPEHEKRMIRQEHILPKIQSLAQKR
ncbi:MAG TPA: family 10 glycosylhydrolase [Phycisphaerae bacterium]|nr:family 10 glycosylhydrolase [Phycisphaerae bacterium]